MPTEPKYNLSALLKTYAEKRRSEAGAPFEVPPVTRRALQAEIARRFPDGTEGVSLVSLLSGFWPRLALGGSVVAVLALAAFVWVQVNNHPRGRLELAQKPDGLAPARAVQDGSVPPPNERPSSAAERSRGLRSEAADSTARDGSPTPAAVSTSAEQLSAKSEMPLVNEGQPIATRPELPQNATPAAPLPMLAQGQRLLESGAKPPPTLETESILKSESLTEKTSALPPSPASVGPAVSVAPKQLERLEAPVATTPSSVTLRRSIDAGSTKERGANSGQGAQSKQVASVPGTAAEILSRARNDSLRADADSPSNVPPLFFNRVDSLDRYRRNLNSPPLPTNVLRAFEIERDGENLRVIDSDGSVYTGTLQSMPANSQAGRAALLSLAANLRDSATNATPANQASRAGGVALSQNVQNGVAESGSFAFQAVGTNRSLNQRVVFTGAFQTEPSAASQAVGGALGGGGFGGGGVGNLGIQANSATQSGSLNDQTRSFRLHDSSARTIGIQAGTAPSGPQPSIQNSVPNLSNGRIEGRAVVGGKNNLKIEAVQIRP